LKQLILLAILISVCFCNGYSQSITNKEVGIISDNDLYTSTYKDRYYTNGTFIYFRYVSKSKKSILKRIREVSIGQKMYTPTPALSHQPLLQDHPYAGHSFIKFKNQDFSKKQFSVKYSIELGVIGPNSKAQEFQEFIHNIYGFEKAEGWDYQIRNALALNIELNYLKPLSKKEKQHFDFTSKSSIIAGTTLTEITTSIYGRLNFLKKGLQTYSNSALFESNISNKSTNNKEMFFFLKPKIGYAIYNATIQGSFLNTNSPVTFKLRPLILEFETGLYYTTRNWNFKYSAKFYKKKHREMSNPYQNYGSILVSYKFN
jgi:hypothetical protein